MTVVLRKETNVYDNETIKSINNKTTAKYGTCSTAASTLAKVVTLSNFTLYTGARISVYFTNANTATAPTLNVNGTGAKEIYAYGSTLAANSPYNWVAKSTVEFVYDGTHWVIADNASLSKVNTLDSLDQTSVFNRLTNNGTAQGIFLQNGQLYINMSYLQTGTLKVGGYNNGDGLIEVYNSSGVRTGRWDNEALYIGNVSSSLSNPNTCIDSNGNIVTKSLTANDYVYVDGNENSFFRIPSAFCSYTFDYYGFHSDSDSNEKLFAGGLVQTASDTYVQVLDFLIYKSSNGYWNQSQGQYADLAYNELIIRGGSTYAHISPGSISVSGSNNSGFQASSGGNVTIGRDLTVWGNKSRLVDTEDYGKRLLYCYETPSPLFGDVGEGTISDDGKCYVMIDNIFAETVNLSQYQVFLQKYGNGDCWVSYKKSSYFIVEGTPGLSFGWELKAKQADFDQLRLEKNQEPIDVSNSEDYSELLIDHIDELRRERTVQAA